MTQYEFEEYMETGAKVLWCTVGAPLLVAGFVILTAVFCVGWVSRNLWRLVRRMRGAR